MTTENNHRRVFLGMPGYGSVAPGAARGFWRATADPSLIWEYREGSLLASNFNKLWCVALNRVRRGQRIDYFAMIHADVQPQDFWLDVMIDELERHSLDVLCAVVPIKEPMRGCTSLALDHEGGGDWEPKCRLTMHEVYRLPETFTSEDVGAPLLCNTGLWVCRFDQSWAPLVHFEVRDRIVLDEATGLYRPQVEPEDWGFSRTCHQLGLRLGATRKVRLTHRGDAEFPNFQPWGQEFDAEYVAQSQLPPQSLDGFRFPYDVEGWLLHQEGQALAELARGKRVLEIGAYCGKSTCCLAQTALKVTCIDPFDGRATPHAMSTLDQLLAAAERYGVADRVYPIVGTTDAAAPELIAAGEQFDLIFIDGDHTEDAVQTDIRFARELLAPGGLLAFHDYRRSAGEHDGRWDPGVTAAVDALVAAGGELISTHATVAVVRPPAESMMEVCHA